MHECDLLPELIRNVDYMVAETYVASTLRSVEDLLNYFEAAKAVRGVFTTTIAFETTTVSFTPPRREIEQRIVQVLDASLDSLHHLPRPLANRLTAKYLPPNVRMLNVQDVTWDTPKYVKLRETVLEHVHSSFDQAEKYVKETFQDKRQIWKFGRNWDPAAFIAETLELGQFRTALSRQRRWTRMVEQMKLSSSVGILLVDSKKMRSGMQVRAGLCRGRTSLLAVYVHVP